MMASNPIMLHPSSPFFHPLAVKEVGGGKGPYIGRNNNSLFFFLSFTPIPSRDARPRIYACVCEGGGERGERSFGAAREPLGVAARVRAVGVVLAHVALVPRAWPSGPTSPRTRRGAKGAGVPKWQRTHGGNGSSLAILGRRWPRERQPTMTLFPS